MGKHGASQQGTSHWDTDWEAAIAPNGEDSLYGSSDGYQAVNDWSGVYEVPAQTGFHEQGAVYDYDDALLVEAGLRGDLIDAGPVVDRLVAVA